MYMDFMQCVLTTKSTSMELFQTVSRNDSQDFYFINR